MMKNNGTLELTLPTDREILLTRTFNAPRRLVWDAMSRPELIMRWLSGPPGWAMTVCDDDLRPGGSFRWAWRDTGSNEMSMHGVYREVVAPERIVRTESFETGCPAQGGEQLCTLVLKEQGGKTSLSLTILYPSKQARDGAAASGMEHGVSASYDKLDELLAEAPVAQR